MARPGRIGSIGLPDFGAVSSAPVTPAGSSASDTLANILAASLPRLSNEAIYKPFGGSQGGITVNQTTGLSTLNVSYNVKVEAEADFDAVALVWVNRAGNAVNNNSALVGVTETAATDTANNRSQVVIGGTAYTAVAAATSTLGWRNVTWNGGAATVNLAAATIEVQYAVSDWIPLSSVPRADGGTRPLLMYRTHHDGSVDGAWGFRSGAGLANLRTPSSSARNRIIQLCDLTGNAVSTPSTVGGLGTTMMEVFPIFRYRRPVLKVMGLGDSNTENSGLVAAIFNNFLWRACADASTPDRPVVPLNMGCSSVGAANFWARGREILNAGIIPDVLVVSPASVNDNYTSATSVDRLYETARARAVEALTFARAKGVKHIIWMPLLPYNSISTAALDAKRADYNAFLASLPNLSRLSFSGLGDGASPERWVAANNFNSDGVHPNEAAIESIMTPALAAELARIRKLYA